MQLGSSHKQNVYTRLIPTICFLDILSGNTAGANKLQRGAGAPTQRKHTKGAKGRISCALTEPWAVSPALNKTWNANTESVWSIAEKTVKESLYPECKAFYTTTAVESISEVAITNPPTHGCLSQGWRNHNQPRPCDTYLLVPSATEPGSLMRYFPLGNGGGLVMYRRKQTQHNKTGIEVESSGKYKQRKD